MAGSGIADLRAPSRRHNPARAGKIETKSEGAAEDATQAQLLRAQARRDPERAAAMLDLANRIDPAMTAEPTTLASKRYRREPRRRLGGELHRLYSSPAGRGSSTFTLLPHGMSVTPEALSDIDPGKLKAQLRADVNRAASRLGTSSEGRFAAIGFDGEYNPTNGLFDLHRHGYGSAATLRLIDELRASPKYSRHGNGRPPGSVS